MKMIQAIIRPKMAVKVADSLETGGFSALTRIDVFGRGKQKGFKIGSVVYDNLPKTMIIMGIEDDKFQPAVKIIEDSVRTGARGL